MRAVPAPSIPSVPVLSPADAGALEVRLLGGDERREWKAMLQAGRSAAEAMLRDYSEIGSFPAGARVLVLAGKGNNAGDALIAAREILERFPRATADVLFAFGPRNLKPLASRAWRGLCEAGRSRARSVGVDALSPSYELSIDGIFGFQYRPPLPPEARAAIAADAGRLIRFRASIDLPTGLDEEGAYRADFTYATGSVKAPVIGCANAGRPRYLDLGFFDAEEADGRGGGDRVLISSILEPLSGLRPASSDKRSQGHLLVVGGSEGFPGAALMMTLSALKSGVGLVTACVPARLAPVYAAHAPEAMWIGLPETPGGGLSRRGLAKILKGAERATALAIGPGLGRDPETHKLALAVVKAAHVPLVIDADALQPDIVRVGNARRILTPHAGELERISKGAALRTLSRSLPAVVVAKGPVTRICSGEAVYHALFGGPVLSRGGSGDLLAGLTGGLLAQTPSDPLLAACRAAAWHGIAADHLARARGQTAVQILEWLDFLAPALRESGPCGAS
jgi:NAD(P)H-hydrate epimerase